MDSHSDIAELPRKRWGIAVLLAFGVVVAFFDRVNISVSQASLHASFGISVVAFGYLSSAYSWTYAVMQIPSGVLLDRFGIKRVGRISTLIWSIASFCAAASTGVGGFVAARFLLGIGESPVFPGNAKAIGSWFPQHERSLAMAITDSAAKFSTAVGVPFLGILLLRFGWRWSFSATGFISLFYFALFYLFYRNPNENKEFYGDGPIITHTDAVLGGKEVTYRRASLDYLLRQRKVYGLALGWGAYNYTFYLLLTWLPSYLLFSLHLDLLHSVSYTSIPWLFATFTDLAVGGWLVDALIQNGWNPHIVRQTILVGGMGLGLGILGAAHPNSVAGALFWISISLGGLAAAAPVAWTAPSLIAPRECVGTIGGIANFCGQLGAISAPIITGYIVSATHRFSSAFVTATVILLVGIAAYVILLGRLEPIPEPG